MIEINHGHELTWRWNTKKLREIKYFGGIRRVTRRNPVYQSAAAFNPCVKRLG